jgi:Ca2+/Na+ antiporter
MAFLLGFHWGWLLGSLLLGLAAGWIAVVHRGKSVSKVLSRSLAALALALVATALTRVVPGRPGYWLDLGLVMFACYLAGCTLGSSLRDWVISRSARAA